MATYIIGDIHGCKESLLRLLQQIDFSPETDRLLHTGDLVNGGPDSLGVVRWFIEHDDVATTVLGNHDLHMLAVAFGLQKMRDKDTFEDILEAPDRRDILAWFCSRPLLHEERDIVLVHAGLLPDWTLECAREAAAEVESLLKTDPARLLKSMYGNKPRRWKEADTDKKRRRLTVNALTRMRALTRRQKLDFRYKGTYEKMPKRLHAWFDAQKPLWEEKRIFFGHWSALGLHVSDRVVALDTGCRWGRHLTAYRLEDGEVIQVECADD